MPVADEFDSRTRRPGSRDWAGSIPRISHGKQHQAACGGILAASARRRVRDAGTSLTLAYQLVAGVGFEPT